MYIYIFRIFIFSTHEIHLENLKLFKEPYHHIHPVLIQELGEHLRQMLEEGAIRSLSPFISNVVIIRKSYYVDYRKLKLSIF